MKKRNRVIEIFSMSALDLFASAMGAFILIAIILMPYYLKISPIVAELNETKKMAQDLKNENEKLEASLQKEKADKPKAFLGFTSKAKSYVILVDLSGSMIEYQDIMVSTASKVINTLDDNTKLQIITFEGDGANAKIGNWQTPRNLSPMDKASKDDAIGFVSQNVAGIIETNRTPTRKALLEALKYDVEAIILMTDGAPNNNFREIVQKVTSINSNKKQIFSIAIGEFNADPKLVEFLTLLSKQNNGTFVGVS